MRRKADNTIFSRAQQDNVRLFLKMQLKHDTKIVHFSWLRRQGKQLNLAQSGTNAYEIHARDFTRSFGKASEKEASDTRVEYPSVACTKVQKRKQPRMSPVQDARYVIKSVICDPNFERLVLGCIDAKFCK